MSSAVEGWYVDPSTGTNLRFWNGNRWTDEVAPLPHVPIHSGPIDPYAEDEPATSLHAAAEPVVFEELDPALERTQLTRRELRARRQEPPPDDAPKHLPPLTMPAAISVTQWESTQQDPAPWDAHPASTPSEPLLADVPASPAAAVMVQTATEEAPDDTDRAAKRVRVLRMSVLLGILAVVSSIAVLTGGAI